MEKVNPTRIELIRLKAKLKMMKNGHQLLKKKRDGLMKEFINIIRQAEQLREKINKELSLAFKFFIFASSEMRLKEIEESVAVPSQKAELEFEKKNIMGVQTPVFNLKREGNFFCYSPISTSLDLDFGLLTFSKILKEIVKLAEAERSALCLALEIEKVRREVNALEHIHIPGLKKVIKYIFSKLNERERFEHIILMKSKEKLISST